MNPSGLVAWLFLFKIGLSSGKPVEDKDAKIVYADKIGG